MNFDSCGKVRVATQQFTVRLGPGHKLPGGCRQLLTAVLAGRASQVFLELFATNTRFYRLFLWEWHMWRWDVAATGDVEGHFGPHGVADAAGHGSAARVWDCAAYRTDQSGRYLVESRDNICVLGALAATRADSSGVGYLGKQSPGQVLQDHPAGKPTTCRDRS